MPAPIERPQATAVESWIFREPTIVRIAGATAIAVGLVVLLGWFADVQLLTTVRPGLASMKANTALAFFLIGISLAASTIRTHRRAFASISRTAAAGVVVIGGATLIEYGFGSIGIDEFIVNDGSYSAGSTPPGRPAPATAANFLLLGIALLLEPSSRPLSRRVAEICGFTVFVIAALALVGYLYGVQSLYRVFPYSSMALHTAATFAVVALGVLCARSDFVVVAPLRSPTAGGVLARRLIPAALILPLVLGWLVLQGEYLGYYDLELGLSLSTASNIAVFCGLIWWVSRAVDDREADRGAAESAAKEALRASEERLRLAQEAAAIGAFELDLRTGANTWTAELERMYGLAPGEFSGTQPAWEQLVLKEDRSHAVATVERAFATGQPQEAEWRTQWPDGSIHWIVGRFKVFSDADGKPLRLMGINLDVTGRKQVERALEAHRADLAHVLRVNTMAEMVAGLAHEINQPLSAIHNFARGAIVRLREGKCEPHTLSEVAQAIADESARASAIVQTLRAYVKKSPSKRVRLDLNAIVRNAARAVSHEVDRRRIVLSVVCHPRLPPLFGDPIQLEQVILNLLLNGVEAMDNCPAGGRLRIQTDLTADGLLVHVADGGPGVPAEISEQIFDAFFTTKANGLGMGLAISRSIVEAHDGTLRLESNAEGGATFCLLLPLDQESAHAP